MIWFACVLALILEGLLAERHHHSLNQWCGSIAEQCEVRFDKLGVPNWAPFQWWIPVALLMLAWWCLLALMQSFSLIWVFVLQALLMLFALRFAQFTRVFTPMQLFINQGDLPRAKETLDHWLHDGQLFTHAEPAQNATDLVQLALQTGTQRGLSQCFAVLFWFLCLPNGYGVVLLLMIQWSVKRSTAQHQNDPSLEIDSKPHDGVHIHQNSWFQNIFISLKSPQKILHMMEWLPARLWAITLAVVSQFDEVLLAWRSARNEGVKSNGQLLLMLCMAVVWPSASSSKTKANTSAVQQQTESHGQDAVVAEAQSHTSSAIALQNFRQLMLRSVIAWMIVFLLLELWAVGL